VDFIPAFSNCLLDTILRRIARYILSRPNELDLVPAEPLKPRRPHFLAVYIATRSLYERMIVPTVTRWERLERCEVITLMILLHHEFIETSHGRIQGRRPPKRPSEIDLPTRQAVDPIRILHGQQKVPLRLHFFTCWLSVVYHLTAASGHTFGLG